MLEMLQFLEAAIILMLVTGLEALRSNIATIMCRAPQAFDDTITESAPHILGAFSDTSAPDTHAALWEMVLSFSRAVPSSWHAVNARKGVLPKLCAFLR